MTRTTQDFAKFLESLKVKNEGPDEMYCWRLDADLDEFIKIAIQDVDRATEHRILYLYERLRRAKSNAKPETLAEDVKAYMRQLMRDVDLAYAEPHQASADRRHRAELACLEWLKVSEAEASK